MTPWKLEHAVLVMQGLRTPYYPRSPGSTAIMQGSVMIAVEFRWQQWLRNYP